MGYGDSGFRHGGCHDRAVRVFFADDVQRRGSRVQRSSEDGKLESSTDDVTDVFCFNDGTSSMTAMGGI